jgi:hypothetical protein
MREILEDAAIIYRHEVESLLIIAAPAAVLGPMGVLIAGTGLRVALAALPIVLLVYLAAYAACVAAARFALGNDDPDPGRSYLEALARAPAVLVAAGPGLLLIGGSIASALVIANEGFRLLALAVVLAGAGGTIWWAARHPYDLPLILAHDARGSEALRAGPQLAERAHEWTRWLLAATGLPLLLALLLSWGLGALIKPAFGAAFFAALLALWLPFAALVLTSACDRLVGEVGEVDEQRQPEPKRAAYY